VQAYFEDKLYQRALSHGGDTLMDLGCGPARGLKGWIDDDEVRQGVAVDNAQGMLNQIVHARITSLKADITSLPLASESVPFVVSNFALQWCDPLAAINEITRILTPNGEAHLVVPIRGSLRELEQASSAIGDSVVNPLATELEWREAAGSLAILSWEKEWYCESFPSLRSLLKALKSTGVGERSRQAFSGLRSKGWLTRLDEAYARSSSGEDYALSWHVLMMQLQKNPVE